MPVQGTNRDKLNKTDIYDLLVKMNQEYILSYPNNLPCCIIQLLDQTHNCNIISDNGCCNCIQKWLNSR
jgi:hypothetical protein